MVIPTPAGVHPASHVMANSLGEKVFYLEEHRPSLGIHRQLSITQPGDLSQPSKNPAGLIVCKHSLLGQHDRVRHVDLRVGVQKRHLCPQLRLDRILDVHGVARITKSSGGECGAFCHQFSNERDLLSDYP